MYRINKNVDTNTWSIHGNDTLELYIYIYISFFKEKTKDQLF